MLPAEQHPEFSPVSTNRRVIHATCCVHGAARGFTNLVLRKLDGQIELDPHATGLCILRLDEQEATVLRDTLGEWLG
jgi:hypothetical protein